MGLQSLACLEPDVIQQPNAEAALIQQQLPVGALRHDVPAPRHRDQVGLLDSGQPADDDNN